MGESELQEDEFDEKDSSQLDSMMQGLEEDEMQDLRIPSDLEDGDDEDEEEGIFPEDDEGSFPEEDAQ